MCHQLDEYAPFLLNKTLVDVTKELRILLLRVGLDKKLFKSILNRRNNLLQIHWFESSQEVSDVALLTHIHNIYFVAQLRSQILNLKHGEQSFYS